MRISSICYLFALSIFTLSVHGVRVVNESTEPIELLVIFADGDKVIVPMPPFSKYHERDCVELYIKRSTSECAMHFDVVNDEMIIEVPEKE